MRRIIYYVIMGLVVLGLTGCSGKSHNTEENIKENITESIKEKTELELESVEISETVESDTEKIEDYIHGDEGYFSLVDEGYGTLVKVQTGGTCWVTAASTSMESAYKIKNGSEIEIDPLDILKKVHGTDKAEGYFIKDGVNGLEIGGWAWQITETLSNGFGDYLLIEAEDYSQVDIDTFKEKIKEKGAMNVAINDARPTLFGTFAGYKTLNDPDSDDFDHEVTIVGWDELKPSIRFYIRRG